MKNNKTNSALIRILLDYINKLFSSFHLKLAEKIKKRALERWENEGGATERKD